MIDLKKISEIVGKNFQVYSQAFRLEALPGDASNRKYYRLFLKNGFGPSMVIMELADPENFKASEEEVSGKPSNIQELPFINIQNFLARNGVGVPEIFYYEKSEGLIFLEDLGDHTLEHEIPKCSPSSLESLYLKALDELLTLQSCGLDPTGVPCLAFERAFDISLWMWEFDHFLEFGIEARNGEKMKDSDREKIRGFFLRISDRLSKEPRCFTHRDYHSRNLMVHQERIRVIDFQDALQGPYLYDLASLLRDSYVSLPDNLIHHLLDYYLKRKKESNNPILNPLRFRESFDLMSIQRNLKAAGRFIYIAQVKKNPRFLPFVAPTLEYVKENLFRYPSLTPLFYLLKPYVKEFQVS